MIRYAFAMVSCLAVTLPLSADVVNGNFQANTCRVPGNGVVTLRRGNACISGWTIGDGTADAGSGTIDLVDDGYWQAPGGSTLSIDLDGVTPGSISQVITTTPGTAYIVGFSLSGNPGGGSPVKMLLVTAGGSSKAYTYDTSVTKNGNKNMAYANQTFSFTATDTSTVLTFASQDVNTPYGPVVGNISIVGPPTISPSGVVPIYGTTNAIQPGEWISIYGNYLATAPATWDGSFPNSLGGTSVTINDRPGYLWYVSPTQINLQAPDDTATGTVLVAVTTSNGTATSTVTLTRFAPSFSMLDAHHVAGVILRSDGSGRYGAGSYDILGPTGSSLGYPTVAAKAGDTIELFGVGFGPTDPHVPAGIAFTGAAPATDSILLTIAGTTITPAFAGLSLSGLFQFNVTLPAGLATGDVPLSASVGGVQTQAGVLISVQ